MRVSNLLSNAWSYAWLSLGLTLLTPPIFYPYSISFFYYNFFNIHLFDWTVGMMVFRDVFLLAVINFLIDEPIFSLSNIASWYAVTGFMANLVGYSLISLAAWFLIQRWLR